MEIENRFELQFNPKTNLYDIIDWVESKEKNVICIYNDIGGDFSSAPALCDLLNKLYKENVKLKGVESRLGGEKMKYTIGDICKEVQRIQYDLEQYGDIESAIIRCKNLDNLIYEIEEGIHEFEVG